MFSTSLGRSVSVAQASFERFRRRQHLHAPIFLTLIPIAVLAAAGTFTRVDAQLCAPLPDGSACQGPCFPNEICSPTKIRRELDGTFRIIECRCLDTFGPPCHVTLLPGPGGSQPGCEWFCPLPTEQCLLFSSGNLDGTIDYWCACSDVLPPCQPGTTTPGCQSVCPPGLACVPVVIRREATGGFTVAACDCRAPDSCRPVVGMLGEVTCIGTCPPGSTCQLTTVTNPDGSIDYRCDCVPVQCGPVPDEQGCDGYCPGPLPCVPTKIRYNSVTGQYRVLACDCTAECHVEIPAVGGPPVCVGGCTNSDQQCHLIVTFVSENEDDYQCVCYQNWVVADDFRIQGPAVCERCQCDVNGDGVCDENDRFCVISCLPPPLPVCDCSRADLNCDGVVDYTDVSIIECLLAGGTQCCAGPQPLIHRIRWYGSHLDSDFEPPGNVRDIDGWLVALHRDRPSIPCPPPPVGGSMPVDLCGTVFPLLNCPPSNIGFQPDGSSSVYELLGYVGPLNARRRICGYLEPNCVPFCGIACIQVQSDLDCVTGISRPAQLVAQWLFPPEAVTVTNAGKVGCDQHRIFSYVTDLQDGCLQHNFAGPDELDPSGSVFRPRPGENYWISIQAEVGLRALPFFCDFINTGQVAKGEFWGWHTTPPGYHNLDDAFMGMLAMGCFGESVYNWASPLHWSDPRFIACADDPTKSIDMAFCLIEVLPSGAEQSHWCQPVNPGPPTNTSPPQLFPPGGIDEFPVTTAVVDIELVDPPVGGVTVNLAGPTVVARGDPIPGGAHDFVPMEILSMNLTGTSPAGSVLLGEIPSLPSTGQTIGPSFDNFPTTESFFDVFVGIDLPDMGLFINSGGAVHVASIAPLWELPPSDATYSMPPLPPPVPLYDRFEPTRLRGYILRVDHNTGPYRGGIDIHSDADWYNMSVDCACEGDLNGDRFVNGLDIQGFINCYLAFGCNCPYMPPCPSLGCPCLCADMNVDRRLDCDDVTLFVDKLLQDPKPACP